MIVSPGNDSSWPCSTKISRNGLITYYTNSLRKSNKNCKIQVYLIREQTRKLSLKNCWERQPISVPVFRSSFFESVTDCEVYLSHDNGAGSVAKQAIINKQVKAARALLPCNSLYLWGSRTSFLQLAIIFVACLQGAGPLDLDYSTAMQSVCKQRVWTHLVASMIMFFVSDPRVSCLLPLSMKQ